MSDYKEILIPGKNTQEIEVETEELDETVSEEEIVDVNLEEETEIEPEVKDVVEPPKKQKEGRAEKRIRQLARERAEALEMLDQARKEKEELQRKMREGEKVSKTTLSTTLQENITSLTTQMIDAMKEGDAEKAGTIQSKLMDAKLQLESMRKDLETPEEEVKPVQKAKGPALPEKALDWLDDHPEFHTDEEFHYATIANNNKLIKEGWDINSSDFYEELNTRLAKRFPEMFGVEETPKVESKVEIDSPDDEGVKTSKTQTVSGSSRPTSQGVPKSPKKNSVTFSQEDIAQAQRFGIPLERLAERISNIEKNKDNGYVPINIKK